MKVCFVGIGLMNGSLSLDIQQRYPDAVIHGVSRKEATLDKALSLGLIHEKGNLARIKKSTMIPSSHF